MRSQCFGLMVEALHAWTCVEEMTTCIDAFIAGVEC